MMSEVKDVTIYYWPMYGRAGATMRILEYAGIPFTHKSEFPDIAGVASVFGGQGDTIAPPILVNGDFTISQSTACAMAAGDMAKINGAITSIPKAQQYLCDIIDFFELGIYGAEGKGAKDLKEYLAGDRFKQIAGNLERSIKGPFYFGDQVTSVDFMLLQHFDWLDVRVLQPCGAANPFADFPKIDGVISAIRNFDSYKSSTTQIAGPDFIKGSDFIEAYKSA